MEYNHNATGSPSHQASSLPSSRADHTTGSISATSAPIGIRSRRDEYTSDSPQTVIGGPPSSSPLSERLYSESTTRPFFAPSWTCLHGHDHQEQRANTIPASSSRWCPGCPICTSADRPEEQSLQGRETLLVNASDRITRFRIIKDTHIDYLREEGKEDEISAIEIFFEREMHNIGQGAGHLLVDGQPRIRQHENRSVSKGERATRGGDAACEDDADQAEIIRRELAGREDQA